MVKKPFTRTGNSGTDYFSSIWCQYLIVKGYGFIFYAFFKRTLTAIMPHNRQPFGFATNIGHHKIYEK